MEEHDDWKLGDEGEITSCARCGKRNRVGLTHCVICGSTLGDELETDPGSLRTLGEAMGGERRVRRAPPRNSWRAWFITAAMLFLVVVVLTWLQTREEPFRLGDWTAPPRATPTPTAAVATKVVLPTKPPMPPSPVLAVAPPAPTVSHATPRPAPRPTATARVIAPARPAPAPTLASPAAAPIRVPATEPVGVPTPAERPGIEATEKPSLGSDLQDATRAYRQAVDLHNQRVDEYNALADEIQRRDAWDDGEASVELRHRLERAREGVESARVHAEILRARMESVRARYR
jgi:hypothetical protein